MSNKAIIVHEFGVLYKEGDKHNLDDVAVPKKSFDNLWNFVLENKVNSDIDQIMSVHSRGGRHFIKTGRYVGTLQTKDGQIIEILPKIYKSSSQNETDEKLCRKIFLLMLRAFQDEKAKSFQFATLDTQSNFPILEVYIFNYLKEVEKLLLAGVKKNYSQIEENQKFLKGKLLIQKQINKNGIDKTKFCVRYSKYIEDIPQNRILVSTLQKLLTVTKSSTNKSHIYSLQNYFLNIKPSENIENDLRISLNKNRLFSSYELLIEWSSQFLLNRGFTTFSGINLNQSLLFSAEKLFESFVASLFKKYAKEYNVDSQHCKYFLVDKHNETGKFHLRPDIFLQSKNDEYYFDTDNIILDTKWKNIDSNKPEKDYLIDIKDMYQLFAYGQKYKLGQSKATGKNIIPKLVLIYPYTDNFQSTLSPFIYEDIKKNIGLKLMVVPFNLADTEHYKEQVLNIIKCAQTKKEQPVYKFNYNYSIAADNTELYVAEDYKSSYLEYMLVGCYKDETHLNWILENHIYNVRTGNRIGAVSKSELLITPTKLLLYSFNNPNEQKLFDLNPSEVVFANDDMMKQKRYPSYQNGNSYLLYFIENEIGFHVKYNVNKLKEVHASSVPSGAPFFVRM